MSKTLKEHILLNKKFIFEEESNAYIYPNLPTKKINGACGSYATISPNEVIVLLDDTLFGGAKNGLVLSEQILFAKGLDGKAAIDIKFIKKIEAFDQAIYINDRKFAEFALIKEITLARLCDSVSYFINSISSENTSPPISAKKNSTIINVDTLKKSPADFVSDIFSAAKDEYSSQVDINNEAMPEIFMLLNGFIFIHVDLIMQYLPQIHNGFKSSSIFEELKNNKDFFDASLLILGIIYSLSYYKIPEGFKEGFEGEDGLLILGLLLSYCESLDKVTSKLGFKRQLQGEEFFVMCSPFWSDKATSSFSKVANTPKPILALNFLKKMLPEKLALELIEKSDVLGRQWYNEICEKCMDI
jgi:hypothetical protein